MDEKMLSHILRNKRIAHIPIIYVIEICIAVAEELEVEDELSLSTK